MLENNIEILVDQAHKIFNQTSIFEVIDLEDRDMAAETLREFYEPASQGDIERYLGVLDLLRAEISP